MKLSFGVTKRAFTVGVVVATILWSVAASFVIAPRVANAAVASGDLVKGSLSAVYYIGSDGKRYVFTNDKAYFTWYANFSTVKTISDTELASIQIGGNVTYRPGVKMVKIQSDPKVYAIAHGGVLRWVATEAAATALFGANWNTKIDDISDAFFVNYTVGTQINSAADYNVSNEQSSSTTINADKGLAGGGAINVTLASDNPAGGTVTRNAQNINLLKASFSGAGTVTGLTFRRGGPGIASDWANIYLYDGDSRLTTGRSVSSTTNEVVFSNLNIALSGGSKMITLVGDLVNPATVANAHYFSLEAATKVVASSTVGGSFPVMGSTFTISGSTGGSLTLDATSAPSNPKVGQMASELANFRITAGGTEDISLRRIVFTNSGSAQLANIPNMKLMTGGTTVAQSPIISGNMFTFVLAVPYVMAKGTNRVFMLTGDIGGANRPNTDTIRVYVDQTYDVFATGNTYGAGVNITNNFTSGAATTLTVEGGQVTFAFNGPIAGDIAIGGNDITIMRFSITSANNIEVRNLRLRLTCTTGGDCIDDGDTAVANNELTDLKVRNVDTGLVVAGPVDIGSWTDAGGDIRTRTYTDRFEVNAGQTLNLALSVDILSANTSLADQTLVAQLDARVLGDLRSLDSNQDVAPADIVPSTALLGNSQTVRSSTLTIGLANSPTSSTAVKGSTVNAVGINFTAGSSSDVKVTQIRLRGLIDANSDGTFAVSDGGQVTQDIIQSATLWDGATQVGTSKSPDTNGDLLFNSLTWNLPAGSTKTLVVKVVISNNAPFGVDTDCANSASVEGLCDEFLIDLLGTNTNNTTNNIVAEDKDANQVTASSTAWAAADDDLNEEDRTVSVINSGTVEVKLDGDTPISSIVTANTNDNTLTKIKFTALNESFLVTRMTVRNENAGSSRSITSVRVFDKNGTLFCSGALDTASRLRCANDAGLFTIGSDHTISIKVNIDQEGTGTTGANSGDEPLMSLFVDQGGGSPFTDDIKVVGVASGTALLDADVDDNGSVGFASSPLKIYDTDTGVNSGGEIFIEGSDQFVIRKTQPTVATVASSTTLINGENTVYKFSVTAAANADVSLKRVVLQASQTGLTNVGNYKLLRGTSNISDLVFIEGDANTGTGGSYDLEGGVTTDTSYFVFITWNTEEVVSAGTTKTFDVKATVTGAGAGDSLTHVIPDDTDGPVTDTVFEVADFGDNDGVVNFIWSDNSADSHLPDGYTSGDPNDESNFDDAGSADWTNGLNVNTLSTSPQSLAL